MTNMIPEHGQLPIPRQSSIWGAGITERQMDADLNKAKNYLALNVFEKMLKRGYNNQTVVNLLEKGIKGLNEHINEMQGKTELSLTEFAQISQKISELDELYILLQKTNVKSQSQLKQLLPKLKLNFRSLQESVNKKFEYEIKVLQFKNKLENHQSILDIPVNDIANFEATIKEMEAMSTKQGYLGLQKTLEKGRELFINATSILKKEPTKHEKLIRLNKRPNSQLESAQLRPEERSRLKGISEEIKKEIKQIGRHLSAKQGNLQSLQIIRKLNNVQAAIENNNIETARALLKEIKNHVKGLSPELLKLSEIKDLPQAIERIERNLSPEEKPEPKEVSKREVRLGLRSRRWEQEREKLSQEIRKRTQETGESQSETFSVDSAKKTKAALPREESIETEQDKPAPIMPQFEGIALHEMLRDLSEATPLELMQKISENRLGEPPEKALENFINNHKEKFTAEDLSFLEKLKHIVYSFSISSGQRKHLGGGPVTSLEKTILDAITLVKTQKENADNQIESHVESTELSAVSKAADVEEEEASIPPDFHQILLHISQARSDRTFINRILDREDRTAINETDYQIAQSTLLSLIKEKQNEFDKTDLPALQHLKHKASFFSVGTGKQVKLGGRKTELQQLVEETIALVKAKEIEKSREKRRAEERPSSYSPLDMPIEAHAPQATISAVADAGAATSGTKGIQQDQEIYLDLGEFSEFQQNLLFLSESSNASELVNRILNRDANNAISKNEYKKASKQLAKLIEADKFQLKELDRSVLGKMQLLISKFHDDNKDLKYVKEKLRIALELKRKSASNLRNVDEEIE